MKRTLAIMVGVVVLCTSLPLLAADKQDKAAKRAAILMQKMKQDLEAEKTAMQSQFEQEKKGLAQALDQAQSAQKMHSVKLQGQLRHSQQLEADKQKLAQEKESLAAQVKQLQTQLAEQSQQLEVASQQLKASSAALESNDQQRKVLVGKVAAEHQQRLSCEEKNNRLYAYGYELVGLYADATVYQKVMRAEPFFQLKRVELENILQGKQSQLLENKVDTIASP